MSMNTHPSGDKDSARHYPLSRLQSNMIDYGRIPSVMVEYRRLYSSPLTLFLLLALLLRYNIISVPE